MPRYLAPVLAAATLAMAPAAMAQQVEFTGGSLRATGVVAFAGGAAVDSERVDGTAQFALSSSTFFEVDAAVTRFGIGGGVFGAAVTGHVGYNVAEDTALGVFASYADASIGFFPGIVTVGAEAVAPLGPVQLETYGAYSFDTAGAGLRIGHLDAFARYPVNERFSVGLGGHYATSNLGLSFLQARATGRYEIADSLYLEAGYGYTRFNAGTTGLHSIGVSLTRTFGGGATFSPRNQLAMFSGF